jgi:hypothetical protein
LSPGFTQLPAVGGGVTFQADLDSGAGHQEYRNLARGDAPLQRDEIRRRLESLTREGASN